MKKLIGGIVVILILAAAGFVGAAYWSGTQAEHWYQDALAEGAKNPNVKFSTTRYERGLFSSQSITRVQLVLPEGESKEIDPSFSIRQDIYHGPLPLAGRSVPGVPMQWGGAVIRATLDPESSAWTRELAKLYGNQEPMVAISRVGFDGASDTQITMPPLTLSNVKDLQSLKFSGLQGQFQVAPRAAAVQGKLTIASLDLIGKPEASEGGQVKLSGLNVNVNQRKGAFNLLFGDSSIGIGELRIQDQATGTPFVATNLAVTGTLNPQGAQQVAGEVVIKADKVTVDQQSGSGSLKLVLRNLDGVTMERLQQWQQKLASQPEDPQALDEFIKLLKTLLRGKPEFTLDSQAKLAQGDWQGKLTLNFQDFSEANLLLDPSALLGAVEKGAAEVAASKALVEALLIDTIKEQLMAQAQAQGNPASEPAVQNLAAQQVEQQLQGLTTAGFIRLEGNQYRSSARFEGGRLFVNGQEIPLGSAAGADDGATEDEIPLEPDDGAEEPTRN
ncbi:MAG: YdgA family protein [Candidatus Contendobacter sp.]|nr:YdgA family protein [Candidatus Contendobacter sp.]MDS4058150.1 YdgA family protein [Candidatus Contendobacter sp.]